MNILLDTHVWIWYFNGSDEIRKSARNIINLAIQENSLYLSAISLWEISMLEKRNRIVLNTPCLEWINKSIALAKINIAPMTPAISVESCHLPGKFHDDPADRIIVATARIDNLTLLTRDTKILSYSHAKHLGTIHA